ncbi:hypothetical protein H6G36_01405 [Anabaena minutissima FACHB-250]|jgi:hypothetical protein|uniref:hypothetical protein n=1 Tax=Nostoc sp. UHCC 0870 TaxID=2914041 RepID=UPI0016827536|nr:hypothetical protein [Nostoc sp. UHCC 0870]MBD2359867.1 hypothetical protein [Anabaena minutissima FACHB-250]UKO97698.1 hypothetical protein L6494_24515 [Nostoc sp. UHCC 0870]
MSTKLLSMLAVNQLTLVVYLDQYGYYHYEIIHGKGVLQNTEIFYNQHSAELTGMLCINSILNYYI